MLALVIAAVMIEGTMSTAVFADGDDLTVDDKVTVTGFETGDTVTAYKFIKWVDGSGWAFVNNSLATYIKLDDIIDGLDKDELATLAKHTDLMTAASGTTNDDTYSNKQFKNLQTTTLISTGFYNTLLSESLKFVYILA